MICILLLIGEKLTGSYKQLKADPILCSTGGLVLKRALVIAMEHALRESSGNPNGVALSTEDVNTYASIVEHCHSIAFFGTPRESTLPG